MPLKFSYKNHSAIAVLMLINVALCAFGFVTSSIGLWLSLFFALALISPFSSYKNNLLLAAFLVFLLSILNFAKIKYLNSPLSEYDFVIIAKLPIYLLKSWYLFAIILLGLVIFLLIKSRKKFLMIVFATAIFGLHYDFYRANLIAIPNDSDALSAIAYSGSEAYFKNINSVFKKSAHKEAVAHDDLNSSAKKYLTRNDENNLPNIVFVFAKSAFDPNKKFFLRSPYEENSLFFAKKDEIYGELTIPANGGGEWDSEFEVMSGISTRALGFNDHLNPAIALRIKTSFVRYLKDKNYTSTAFISSAEIFSDLKKNYGFDEVLNSSDLSKKLAESSKNPFFFYVTLNEISATTPHCKRDFLSKEAFRLARDGSFSHNCEFDEYLKKAKLAESRILALEEKMREIELKTGRPFLMIIFGGLEQSVFTTKAYEINKIKDSDQNVTFYKVIKSRSISLSKMPNFIPINLVPSLVSSTLTADSESFYVMENFYLFERCATNSDVDQCSENLGSSYINYEKYFRF
jgi:hypothetical protein